VEDWGPCDYQGNWLKQLKQYGELDGQNSSVLQTHLQIKWRSSQKKKPKEIPDRVYGTGYRLQASGIEKYTTSLGPSETASFHHRID
jgi:hypothetical protein